jgi:hypothetical protein
MTMSARMLNEEELRANVPSNVFQQHKEMERVCGRSGKVELLMVAASFIFLAFGRQATRMPTMSAGGRYDARGFPSAHRGSPR